MRDGLHALEMATLHRGTSGGRRWRTGAEGCMVARDNGQKRRVVHRRKHVATLTPESTQDNIALL